MLRVFSIVLICVLASTSCARFGKKADPSPFGPSGVPPQLRKSEDGQAVAAGGNVQAQALAVANATPDSEVFFTDPDAPDDLAPELSKLLESQSKGPWEQSETVAKQRASREGKPLLIWFTDSSVSGSAMSKALSEELFSTSDFEKWASEHLVRLRVDANVRAGGDNPNFSLDQKMSRETEIRNYVTELKKRYKVIGHPVVLMLNPSGEVIGRYRGYKRGEAAYFWGLIKQGEAVASNAYKNWREKLGKKGYREWQDPRGRKVFAKLAAYQDGNLLLIEPDGTRSKTKESNLSSADRDWLKQQKEMRNLR
jgi:hypothetical protein